MQHFIHVKDAANHALIWVVYDALLCVCAALTALAFFLIHTFSMVITFNAYTNDERSQQLFVPVMHLGAALLVWFSQTSFSIIIATLTHRAPDELESRCFFSRQCMGVASQLGHKLALVSFLTCVFDDDVQTLINLLPNGCTAGVPLVFLCAAVTMGYGGKIVWDNVGYHSLNPGDLQRRQS